MMLTKNMKKFELVIAYRSPNNFKLYATNKR